MESYHTLKLTRNNAELGPQPIRDFSGQVIVKLSSMKAKLAGDECEGVSLVCGHCDKMPPFFDFHSLVWHTLVTHFQQCSFYCDLCRQTFEISAFAKHFKIHFELPKEDDSRETDSPKNPAGTGTTDSCQAEKSTSPEIPCAKDQFSSNDSDVISREKSATFIRRKLLNQCKKCGKQCSSNQRLHCKKSNVMRFKCDVCEKRFRKKAGLRSHYMSHTGEKPYVCAECGKQFSQLANLKRHEILHKGEKPFICPHCGRTFAQKALLKLHEANIHLEDKGFQCDVCKKQFGAKDALKNHMRIHTGEKPYSCSQCGKSFSMHGNLFNHKRVHTGEKPHLCTLCGKAFKQSSHLKTHMRSHSRCSKPKGSKNGAMTCDLFSEFSAEISVKISSVKPARNELGDTYLVCERCVDRPTFNDFQSILWHIILTHHQECSFFCDLCMQTFGITVFAKHIGIHCQETESPKNSTDSGTSSVAFAKTDYKHEEITPIDCQVTIKVEEPNSDTEVATLIDQTKSKKLPHRCKKCGNDFLTRQKLRDHSQKVHPRADRYKCDLCKKDCKNSTGLKTHYMKHTGEKPYVCAECGKQFGQLPNLRRHEIMHSGEKPFICSHCGRAFAHKAQLRQHEANMHVEEKEFQCDFCKKRFGVKRALHHHIKSHTGDKQHRCPVCGKLFTMAWNLGKHMRVHTGEKPYNCTVCGKAFKQTSHLKTHMKIHSTSHPDGNVIIFK